MKNTWFTKPHLVTVGAIIGFIVFIYLSVSTNNDPAGIDKLKTVITLFIVLTHLIIAIYYLYCLSTDNDSDNNAHIFRIGLTLLAILLTGILTYFVSLGWFSNFIPLNRNIDLKSALPKAGDIFINNYNIIPMFGNFIKSITAKGKTATFVCISGLPFLLQGIEMVTIMGFSNKAKDVSNRIFVYFTIFLVIVIAFIIYAYQYRY